MSAASLLCKCGGTGRYVTTKNEGGVVVAIEVPCHACAEDEQLTDARPHDLDPEGCWSSVPDRSLGDEQELAHAWVEP